MGTKSLTKKRRKVKKSWRALGFDSGFEHDVYMQCPVKMEHHPCRIPYTYVHTYTPDFLLKTKKGKTILIETKGRFLSKDRTKHLLLLRQHAGLDLRLVFMNAKTRLSKRSKTTYGEWCDKHGIVWAEKQVPKDWVNE